MKVTSLNLAGYKNWTERASNIAAYLDQAQSDIVFFQEVMFDAENSPYPQSKQINDKLSMPYHNSHASITRYYLHSDGHESREGLAVLSRFPVTNSETIVLTKHTDDKHTRIIQKVDIQVNGQNVTFTNVHFSNNQYSTEQLAETLQIIKATEGKGVILGDFNIFDITSVKNLYSNDYIVSTDFSKYISFPAEQATLDYVLLPLGYSFTSLSLGENLSDHNALTFDFSL